MSADTNYATPEPAANVISLPSPLPPQLENVVDTPGYSEVPVHIKKVLCILLRGHTYYSPHFRPIVTGRRVQHELLKYELPSCYSHISSKSF